MTFLNTAEKDKIAEAIRRAEARTSGELVTVIARSADPYSYVQLSWPALIALPLPAILALFAPSLSVMHLLITQMAAFIALQLALLIPSMKMRLVPESVKHRRARRLAREQFFEQGLHLTKDRSGVLIFVSVAEHYVEIIADEGINANVAPGTWDDVVANMVTDVRAGQIADGFLTAINVVGDQLAERFPRSDGDQNELPNHLIEI